MQAGNTRVLPTFLWPLYYQEPVLVIRTLLTQHAHPGVILSWGFLLALAWVVHHTEADKIRGIPVLNLTNQYSKGPGTTVDMLKSLLQAIPFYTLKGGVIF